MRIAVSAEGDRGLESVVSFHFGRCPFYILADVEDGQVQEVWTVENPYYGQHVPGQVPVFIQSQGVEVMLTGGMGRRAIALFEEYGIEAVTGAQGTVRRALESYLGGQLRGVEPCQESQGHVPPQLWSQGPPPSGTALLPGKLSQVRNPDGERVERTDELIRR